MEFDTQKLPATPDVTAPDGSDVRILLGLQGGGMAHFELQPGQTSKAVTHRTVEEIWFFSPAAVKCGGGRTTARKSWRSSRASA